MGLFGNFFTSKRAESVVLVDIAADSVGGAYARFEEGKTPALLYTNRVAIEARPGEASEQGLARALTTLGIALLKEGAPALARVAGNGHVDAIFASIGTPWQESQVRTESIENAKPFTFTHAMVAAAIKKSAEEPEGKLLADEVLIATFLNGYATAAPFGKKATRANILVLAAAFDRAVADMVGSSLRRLYHTHHIKLLASPAVFKDAVEALFPHEDEYLVLAASGASGTILLVKRALLVATASATLAGEAASALEASLSELAKNHPLPHTVFLIAPKEEDRQRLIAAFNEKRFASLWLSDDPVRIISVLPENVTAHVAVRGAASRDLGLSLLAMFYAQQG